MALTDQDVALARRALKDVSFLQYLNAAEVDQLMQVFDKAVIKKGEVLIEEGTIGSIFYLLTTGTVGVYRKRAFLDKRIALLGPGSFFGEMALVNKRPRSATVACEEDGMVFTLLREDFRNILLANPHISDMITRTAVKRMEELVDIEIEERISRKRQASDQPKE
jgi:voltage-gated potassium channel